MGMPAWVPECRGVLGAGGLFCAQEAVSMQELSDVWIPGIVAPSRAQAQGELLVLICMEPA